MKQRKEAIVYFDGAYRSSTGITSAGAVIIDRSTQEQMPFATLLDSSSNNVAEYEGAILGLTNAKLLGYTHITLRGDSMLVICQIKGTVFDQNPANKGLHRPEGCWRLKKEHLRPFNLRAAKLVQSFEECWLEWIPNAENKLAHASAASVIPTIRLQKAHEKAQVF